MEVTTVLTIGRRNWRAQSFSCYHERMKGFCKAVGAAILLTLPIASCYAQRPAPPAIDRSSGMAATKQAFLTNDCAPCRVSVGAQGPAVMVYFEYANASNGQRRVSGLRLTRQDKPGWKQTLAVKEMTFVRTNEKFFLGSEDVNFDGYNDLLLATARGVANTYCDYWLFVPGRGDFAYLGNFPIFTLDRAKKLLQTFERGGDGGKIYTSNSYEFRNGSLTMIASEKQESDYQGAYVRKQYRFENGGLKLKKMERIRP